MSVKILLSIKPEYANKILSGEKKYEFRRFSLMNSAVTTVVIYATKPVGQVIGEFEIEAMIKESPERLWQMTHEYAGVDKHFFDAYFSGKSVGVAIKVGTVSRYENPKRLEDLGANVKAPQSFRYL